MSHLYFYNVYLVKKFCHFREDFPEWKAATHTHTHTAVTLWTPRGHCSDNVSHSAWSIPGTLCGEIELWLNACVSLSLPSINPPLSCVKTALRGQSHSNIIKGLVAHPQRTCVLHYSFIWAYFSIGKKTIIRFKQY